MLIINSKLQIAHNKLQITNYKGLASYCKAKTTCTFHSCILTLSNALLSINNREMKSESGLSLAMASLPLQKAKSKLLTNNK